MSKHISTAYLKRQALFWLGAALIFILFVYVFRSVLLPFVAGLALAYFMDPVADFFERRGLSRMASTIVILLLFVIALVIALAVIVPILITQANDFFSNFPQYVSQLQGLFSRLSLETGWLANYIGINAEDLQGGFNELLKQGAGFLTTLFQGLWSSGKAVIDVAGLLIVTPVVAFYMLLDWDRMVDKIDAWTPRQHPQRLRRQHPRPSRPGRQPMPPVTADSGCPATRHCLSSAMRPPLHSTGSTRRSSPTTPRCSVWSPASRGSPTGPSCQ